MTATGALAALPFPSGVSYGFFREAWHDHAGAVQRLIEHCGARTVCEIGGGANPSLPLAFVRERGLDCTILDVSRAELDKSPAGYRKVAADICGDVVPLAGRFDFMFSKMLAEHVASGQAFHRNVFRLLAPGGLAFHFFPTLYAPAFVANRLLPEDLAGIALQAFAPRDRHRHGKFPARYSWCRGPTRRQLARLEALGYEVVAYRGFFGHDYYRRIAPLHWASRRAADWLCRHPWAPATTFALVLLRKPGGAPGSPQ
jgi:SAM-dependent methyltransferase